MKNPQKEEEKPDGLEITSIGSLYKGPWDKKYWSSSRGKDRYPYPVGYTAIRSHNGSTYRMEIHEGLKGPLFMIASADGQLCSGQTPDIVWENFQKKGFPRVKLLHGKRLSCKIDGVEFFGFRNPFVQRLLRELVANVNGTAERNFLSSSLCNAASRAEHDTKCSDPCIYPDLLADLARPQITGRRSRKRKIINKQSIGCASPKKLQHQDMTCIAKASNSRQVNQGNHNDRNFIISSDHLREEALLPQEESQFVSLENSLLSEVANNLSTEEKPLDRSQDTEMQGFSFSMAMEGRNGAKDAPGISDGDICVPDTLDLLQEGPQTESHPEEAMGTSTSNEYSEKSDFDSVGPEIAKSMMNVLLPQALPLLEKGSRKKNKTIKCSEISPSMVKSQEENNGSHFEDVTSPARMLTENSHVVYVETEGDMHILSKYPGSVVPSFEHIKSVVPDSYENDECQHATNPITLLSDNAEVDQAIDKNRSIHDTLGLGGRVYALKESSDCHAEIRGTKEIFFSDVQMASDKKPQRGDIFLSESSLGCTSPSKKIHSERSKEVCSDLNENSKCLEIHYEEKDHKIVPEYTEDANNASLMGKGSCFEISQKEINVNMGGVGAGSTSFTQITDVASLTRKFNGPLSESIGCRNFGDGCVPETHPAKGTLPAPEILQENSSDVRPNQNVSAGSEARFEGQVNSLHPEKTTLNPEAIFYTIDPAVSHNQSVSCAFEDKDTTDILNPLVSHIEKNGAYVEQEHVRHQNLAEFKTSELQFQEQGKNLCANNTFEANEVQTGSDLKPRMNEELNIELEGPVKLVGCYMHPMPVLSVLLRTMGNEINICVLCGLLADKERTLFIYKLPIKEPSAGCPSFIGHASIMLPISKDTFGRQIALDRSGLQLTPDGLCLVLLNSIEVPYCREQKIHCLCSACTSDCFEENAVKIVQVKLGYVSLVTKLKTVDSVHCILVCEPNHLVAVDDRGRLHLWVMNPTWSAQTEEFVTPTYDCISPSVVELKKIPNCASLVLGHNGFGEFGLWDISKCILVSRFSAPNSPVFQFLPISLINCKRKGSISNNPNVVEKINRIMAATKMCFSEHSENHAFLPSEEHDTAIWLLVSTVPDSDAQHNYQSDSQVNPVGWWRLALLVKNMVILGSSLDPRAAAIGASAGHGMIATCDGLVYMWELSTGSKLGTLHYFKGGGVSCVATDNSNTGVLAVAGDQKLLIYLHSQRDFTI